MNFLKNPGKTLLRSPGYSEADSELQKSQFADVTFTAPGKIMPRRAAKDKNRNITRIDASAHGYWVRVMRRGECFSKLFSDGEYGGKRKALKAARDYRDQLVDDLADKEQTRKQRAEIVTSRNYSGIPGVRYIEETSRKGDREYVYGYWEAQWSPKPYVRKKRRFSVKKYGDKKAMELAIEARAKGVEEMVD